VAGRRAGRQTLLRTPGEGAGRLGRIGLFSAAPLVLASGAHSVGGGTLPFTGVALSAVVLLLVSTCVSARRCRFPVLVGLLGVEQVLLHLLFTAAETASMCLPAEAMAGGVHAGHGVGGRVDATAGAALEACASGHAMSFDWLMISAHVVATVIVSWTLARGEAWWWRTVAQLVRIVSARPTRRRPRPALVVGARRRTASRLTLAAASPRGPPLFS
jgi:hypothetical protein